MKTKPAHNKQFSEIGDKVMNNDTMSVKEVKE